MKKEYCECCGQAIMKHKHSLSKSLVKILVKVGHKRKSFHLQKDVGFTKNEYANFQKLKYWGFVSRDVDRSGYWYITGTGRRFLSDEISAPRSVWTFNNRVVDQEGNTRITDCLHFTEVDAYKRRSEYAEDAQPTFDKGSLF